MTPRKRTLADDLEAAHVTIDERDAEIKALRAAPLQIVQRIEAVSFDAVMATLREDGSVSSDYASEAKKALGAIERYLRIKGAADAR